MSFNPSNPFVLPGLGQTGDAASNPLFASIEMMRQAFAGLAGQTSAGGGLPLGASLDPAELEKRINELKTVENWLKLNLSMLSSTIQGMEVQLATIHTLKSFVSSAMGSGAVEGGPARSPLEVVLGLRPFAPAPAPQAAPAPAPAPEREPEPQPEREPPAAVTPPPAANEAADSKAAASGSAKPKSGATSAAQVPEAAQAWWNLLQQQFGQVAAATAATMAGAPAADTPAAKRAPAKKSPAAAKKAAARKSTKSSATARKKPIG